MSVSDDSLMACTGIFEEGMWIVLHLGIPLSLLGCCTDVSACKHADVPLHACCAVHWLVTLFAPSMKGALSVVTVLSRHATV